MTPPSAPPSGPSFKQAFGLIAAASLLLSSTCFGAFGIGSVLTGTAGDVIVPFILLAGLIGLVGLMIGVGALIGRMFRRGLGTAAPSVTGVGGAPVPAGSGAAVASSRPTYGQASLLFLAGTLVFLSTCFAVVDNGGRRASLPWLSTALLVLGMLAAIWGFLVMVVRLLALVRGRRAAAAVASDAPAGTTGPEA